MHVLLLEQALNGRDAARERAVKAHRVDCQSVHVLRSVAGCAGQQDAGEVSYQG